MVKLNKQDYEKWTQFRMGKKSNISREELEMVSDFHSRYYEGGHKYFIPCTCSPRIINQWIADLNKIWENGSE
jgi:hypothetical protein